MPFHKYFTYLDFYKQAMTLSLKDKVDIVHCHDLNTLKIGIDLKAKTGCKLVYDSHELYLHKNRLDSVGSFKKMLLTRIESKGMKSADLVITVGYKIADWLAKEYKSETPTVILNAPGLRKIDADSASSEKSLRRALQIPEGQKLMVYSGGITFNRGLENILKAVAQVPEIHFVMMGFGSETYLDSLRSLISEYNIESRVDFFGPVEHYEVPQYLSSADFGVAPIINICLSYYYCSPNKLFEFIQARLPVISSNFPEMQRVVDEYEIGFTFDPEDVSEIVSAISEMISDNQRRLMYKANTDKAAERYNWDIESESLLSHYTKLTA